MADMIEVSQEFRMAIDKPTGDIKAYLAAGWFNPKKLEALTQMENVVSQFKDIKTFEPKNDSPQIGRAPTEKQRQDNFDSNLEAIRTSDVIFASTEGLDSGTIWECGYASALNIPVFGFAPFLPKGVPFNLMLAQSIVTGKQIGRAHV